MTSSIFTEDLIAMYNKLPFALDERSFNQWLNDLNLVDKVRTLKLLYSTLQVMNKEEIPPESRFFFLHKISLLVEQLSVKLRATYVKSYLPFSKEDKLKVELSACCALESAKNYVLLCKDKKFNGSDIFTQKQKALIMCRAIQAQANAYLYTSMFYEKPEKGFWSSCYLFYIHAKQNNVMDFVINEQGTCFINLFKQLLVFELSNTQQFTIEEILAVFRLFNKTSERVDLLTKVPEKKYKGIPCINLRNDEPPSLAKKESGQEDLYLIYISSLNVIKQLLKILSDKKNAVGCTNVTLLRLIKTLTMNQQRKTERELADGEIFAVIGFDEIEALILDNNKKLPSHDGPGPGEIGDLKFDITQIDKRSQHLIVDDFRNDQQANFAIVDNFDVIEEVKSSDIWGSKKEEPKQEATKPVANAEFIDKSPSGFKLHLKDETAAIKVGDIIGLIIAEIMVITVVRRIIQAQRRETLVGVEMLGNVSELLHIFNTDSKGAVWGLYLNSEEENESIIIKTKDFHNEAYLFADNDEKITKYRVEKQLHAFSTIRQLKVCRC